MVVIDFKSGRSRNFGFVTFTNESSTNEAKNNKELGNITNNKAQAPTETRIRKSQVKVQKERQLLHLEVSFGKE